MSNLTLTSQPNKEWDIYNVSGWVSLTEPEALNTFFTDTLLKGEFTVLGEIDYHFQPQGWTKLFLLAESHLAIHTFPENGKTYWELSSCSQSKYDIFREEIQKIKN
jgi:S-adenosylmethionine decarboxylase